MHMKNLKSITIFIMALILGVIGVILLFGDCESITILLLSKLFATGILYTAFKLYNQFKTDNNLNY